jgi:hypothetical protein
VSVRRPRAIHEVLCGRCGEPTAEAHAEVRRGYRPCGLCRAEMLGKIYLVGPTPVPQSPVIPTGGEAIHESLRKWAEDLLTLALDVKLFAQHLMETSPEEAVAEAVLGEEPLAGVTLRPLSVDPRALALAGLPPDVARRLVQDTFARPPSCGEEDKA